MFNFHYIEWLYSIFEKMEILLKLHFLQISELCERNFKIFSLMASSGVYLSVHKRFWPRDCTWAAGPGGKVPRVAPSLEKL